MQHFRHGVHLCSVTLEFGLWLSRLVGDVESYLDYQASCQAWSGESVVRSLPRGRNEPVKFADPVVKNRQLMVNRLSKNTDPSAEPTASEADAVALKKTVQAVCQALMANEETLNRMDSGGGVNFLANLS